MFLKHGMLWIIRLLLQQRNIIVIIVVNIISFDSRWSANTKHKKPILLLSSSSLSFGFFINGAIQPQDSYLPHGSNHTIKCTVYTSSSSSSSSSLSSSLNISMPTLRGFADVILEENCSAVERAGAFGKTLSSPFHPSIRRRVDDDNDDDIEERGAWSCREVVYQVVNVTRSLDSVHYCQVDYGGKIQVVGAATIRVGDKPITIRDLVTLTSSKSKVFYVFHCTRNTLDRCYMEIGKKGRRHYERNVMNSMNYGNISCRYFRYSDDNDDDIDDNVDGDKYGDRDGGRNWVGSELNATVTCQNIFSVKPSISNITLRLKAPIRILSYTPLHDGVTTLTFQGPEEWDYRLMPLLCCVYKDGRPIENFCLNEHPTSSHSFNREIRLDDIPDSSNITLCFHLMLNDLSTPGDVLETKSVCQGECRQGYERVEVGSCEIISIWKSSSPPMIVILLLCIFIIPLIIAVTVFALKCVLSPYFSQENLSIQVPQNFHENLTTKEDSYSTLNPYEIAENIEKQSNQSQHLNIRSVKKDDEDESRLLQDFSLDQSFASVLAASTISEATSSASRVAMNATTPNSTVNTSFSDVGNIRETNCFTKSINIPFYTNPQLAEFQSSVRFRSDSEMENEKLNYPEKGEAWMDCRMERYYASYAMAQLTEPTCVLNLFTTKAKSLTFLETKT